MNKVPREIRREEGRGVFIRWSTGAESTLTSEILRRACPCAGCKESRGDTSHSKPLTGRPSTLKILKSTIDEEINLRQITPIGNYAVRLQWGDGHNTGIYTYEYLNELCELGTKIA